MDIAVKQNITIVPLFLIRLQKLLGPCIIFFNHFCAVAPSSVIMITLTKALQFQSSIHLYINVHTVRITRVDVHFYQKL
jgi:hypothetical protein